MDPFWIFRVKIDFRSWQTRGQSFYHEKDQLIQWRFLIGIWSNLAIKRLFVGPIWPSLSLYLAKQKAHKRFKYFKSVLRLQKPPHSSHTGSRRWDFLGNVKFWNPENVVFQRYFQQKQVGFLHFPYNFDPLGPYESDKHQHFHRPIGTWVHWSLEVKNWRLCQ